MSRYHASLAEETLVGCSISPAGELLVTAGSRLEGVVAIFDAGQRKDVSGVDVRATAQTDPDGPSFRLEFDKDGNRGPYAKHEVGFYVDEANAIPANVYDDPNIQGEITGIFEVAVIIDSGSHDGIPAGANGDKRDSVVQIPFKVLPSPLGVV